MHAPLATGDDELRYLTGRARTVLARDDLRVTPAREEPGLVRVSAC